MDSLDLDIHNYTIADIETFFQFKPKSKYSAADIEFHEYRIREQLLQSGHINKRYKRDLIAFLETAKEWLTLVKCPPPKPPTIGLLLKNGISRSLKRKPEIKWYHSTITVKQITPKKLTSLILP